MPENEMIILFVAVGVLLIGLSLPLIRRKVKPNALYGLRVNATFADEWVWYEANARSGRDLLHVGAIQLLVALVLPLAGISETAYALINAGVLLVGTLWAAIAGWRRANRLLESRTQAQGSDPGF